MVWGGLIFDTPMSFLNESDVVLVLRKTEGKPLIVDSTSGPVVRQRSERLRRRRGHCQGWAVSSQIPCETGRPGSVNGNPSASSCHTRHVTRVCYFEALPG